MYSMFESVSRGLELHGKVGPVTIASYERFMACQLDAIEKFFVPNGQKIRAILFRNSLLHSEQWTDATLALLQTVVRLPTKNIVQLPLNAIWSLCAELQKQATEMQGLLFHFLRQPSSAWNGGAEPQQNGPP